MEQPLLFPTPLSANKRRRMGYQKGTPDLLAFLPDRKIAIEFKAEVPNKSIHTHIKATQSHTHTHTHTHT